VRAETDLGREESPRDGCGDEREKPSGCEGQGGIPQSGKLPWTSDPGANASPEARDHFGKADHLLDAVADQVSQVREHGEVGEVDVHGGALVVLLGEDQVGEHWGLHGLCGEGAAQRAPGAAGWMLRGEGSAARPPQRWRPSCQEGSVLPPGSRTRGAGLRVRRLPTAPRFWHRGLSLLSWAVMEPGRSRSSDAAAQRPRRGHEDEEGTGASLL